MTANKKIEEIRTKFNVPGGLHNYTHKIINSLFTDSTLKRVSIKDIATMTDKIFFFYKKQVIFELDIPSLDTKQRKGLTKRLQDYI